MKYFAVAALFLAIGVANASIESSVVKASKLFSVSRESAAKRTHKSATGGAISERELEFEKRTAMKDTRLMNDAAGEAVTEARKKALEAGMQRCKSEFTVCSEENTKITLTTQTSVEIDSEDRKLEADDFQQRLAVASAVTVTAKATILIRGSNPKIPSAAEGTFPGKALNLKAADDTAKEEPNAKAATYVEEANIVPAQSAIQAPRAYESEAAALKAEVVVRKPAVDPGKTVRRSKLANELPSDVKEAGQTE